MSRKRTIHTHKLPCPRINTTRGSPINPYNELKSNIHIILKPTIINILNKLSATLILPRSVLREEIFRNSDFVAQFRDFILPFSQEIQSLRNAKYSMYINWQ